MARTIYAAYVYCEVVMIIVIRFTFASLLKASGSWQDGRWYFLPNKNYHKLLNQMEIKPERGVRIDELMM